MNKSNPISPPRWLLRFFRWYCHPDYVEDIEGDLCERFANTAAAKNILRARWRFLIEVLFLFRPGIIKPISDTPFFIPIGMFRHNLLITYRSFMRNKSSFLINLIGLSTGMACVLLIYLWVNDELSVDTFHEQNSRLYQVMEHIESDGVIRTSFETSAPLVEFLQAEMPEVEYAAAVAPTTWYNFDRLTLSVGEKNIKAAGQYVGPDYFKIFSYNLIQGQKDQVLQDKNAIVISEELATRLFGTTVGVLGKEIEFNHERTFLVSGIFSSPPVNATVQFDFAMSFELFKDIAPWVTHWDTGPYVYLTVKEGTNIDHLNEKISGTVTKIHENSSRTLFLKPYSDRYLHGKYENGKLIGGRIEYVKLFSLIAFFILLIACINFMNLSTAKAASRLKEIGVKKTIGASRLGLMIQYLGESIIMAFLALFLGLLIVGVCLPEFNLITGKQLSLNVNLNLALWVLGVTLLTGILAGSYPAIYLSGFKTLQVLKGKLNVSFGEIWVRKGLVVFQFGLSMILIVGVGVVYQQISFIQTQHLGYSKENIIYFDIQGNISANQESFLAQLKTIPGVVNASSTSHDMSGSSWTTWGGVYWEGKDPKDETVFEVVSANYDLLETLDIQVKEGRAFSREFPTDSFGVIFNEAAINHMGFRESPLDQQAGYRGEMRQIVGVVKDFHFESFHQEIKPMVISVLPEAFKMIMVRIAAGQEKEVLARLQEVYQKNNPGFPFAYRFIDEDYQAQYVSEQQVSRLSRYFAGLAILISCLGLFGLAAYTAERRTKEIGIRKILGASVWSILTLLTSEFIIMVFVAILISIPISFLVVNRWLEGFAYKIDLEWWFFAGAALIAISIAWITVGTQTFRAASVNPAQCLRNE